MRLHGFFTKALLEGLGWDDGIKGNLSDSVDEDYIDIEDRIQGELAQGLPPANKNNILSVDSLVSYIKENQEIALNSMYSESQYPQVLGDRYDLVLFEF